MGVSCLSCVVKPCAPANEDAQRRRCPKASKCGSRTKDHSGIRARPQTAKISSALSRASRHRPGCCHYRYSCQSSGSLPYVAETTLCGLSQTYQYVCEEDRTTPRTVRCILDCT